MKKRSIIVLNIFFICLIFLSHWLVIIQMIKGILETTWYVVNYNFLVFNWVNKFSALDFCLLLMVLMIITNIFLYVREKE